MALRGEASPVQPVEYSDKGQGRGLTHAEASRKFAIDFFSVQCRSRINFWSETHSLAGRLLNGKVEEGHISDVLIHCKHASWPDPRRQSHRWSLPCSPSWQRPTNSFANAQLMPQLHGLRRSVSSERMQNSRTKSTELQNPVAQEREKDSKLSRSPPHNCACCAKLPSATLHSALCVRSATSAFLKNRILFLPSDCFTAGLHNGTRLLVALIRFVSAALITFMHIIVTSLPAFCCCLHCVCLLTFVAKARSVRIHLTHETVAIHQFLGNLVRTVCVCTSCVTVRAVSSI